MAASQQRLASELVAVSYRKAGIVTTPSYFLFIDLDNAGGAGPYKHQAGAGVRLARVVGSLVKSNITDQWRIDFGVVLSIGASDATIAWIRAGCLSLQDTNNVQDRFDMQFSPLVLPLAVEGGALTCVAASFIETVADLATGIQIPDVGGTSRGAAPGDIVLRVTRQSGSSAVLFHHMAFYYVE